MSNTPIWFTDSRRSPLPLTEYSNMGIACGKLEQYPEALAACKKAIDLNPDSAVAYYNMGLVYNCLGQYTCAIAAFKKATAIAPNYADAYINMGSSYSGLKQYPEAIAAYKKCISIKPTGETAVHAGMFIGRISRKHFKQGIKFGRRNTK